MNPFWSSYRALWMSAINAAIASQKLMLAQVKWLLAQGRSGATRPAPRAPVERIARPALAAAQQAADAQRIEHAPARRPRRKPTARKAR